MLAGLRKLLARRLPWWLVLVIGIACVVLGGFLIADPFRSLTVLTWVVGAALIVSGVGEIASAATASRQWTSYLVGVVWIGAGVLAVAWPGITIGALAIAAGVALVVGGLVKILAALLGGGDERLIQGVSGLTNAIVGLLALAWPDATVLVLAVLFGIGIAVFGFGQLATAIKLRRDADEPSTTEKRWPPWLRLTAAVAGLALALGAMAISVAIDRAAPDEPGDFYAVPSPLPDGPPGTIVRTEIVDGYQPEATTYRVLYTSTGYDGEPTAASGLILVPDGEPPADGRQVVAYTHGTVGVTSRCAPSLAPPSLHPLFLEGGDALLDAGYVIATSDYQGLGTPDPHPYLVGESEAMNTLDSVRAARNLAEADAGDEFVTWGHSQGGHASVFSGQLAAGYAPELRLRGVAAGAPVPNLVDLFKVNIETRVGKILIAMALHSWEQVYDDADLDQIATPASRPFIARIAENCLYNQKQILASVPSALVLGLTFLHTPVWEVEPWKTIAEDNTPGAAPTDVPMLIVQSRDDHIVDPAVTERFVDRLCERGETVELRLYPGGHLLTGNVAAPDVASWIADRFAGRPPPNTCT